MIKTLGRSWTRWARRILSARSCTVLGLPACCSTTIGQQPEITVGASIEHRLGAVQGPISLYLVLHTTMKERSSVSVKVTRSLSPTHYPPTTAST